MNSLFRKIFIAFLTVILIFSILVYIITSESIRDNNRDKLRNELENYSDLISLQVAPFVKSQNASKIDSILSHIRQFSDYRITVIRHDGFVYADTEKDAKAMDNHLSRPEVIQSLTEKYGTSIRYSLTVKSDLLYVSRLLSIDDKKSGYVRVSFWLKTITDSESKFRNDYIESVFYISLLSILIAYFLSVNLTRPIKRLVKFAKILPQNNFKDRIKNSNTDEIGQLTENMNNMAENIETLFNKLDNEKESIVTIINNMADGLIVFNKDKEAVLANNKMKEILGIDKILGKYIWETVQNKSIYDFIESILATKNNSRKEFNIGQSVFLVSFSYLQSKEEIICIFYDITEQKQLEIQKKDFVTNVSHELRTPLTSIQGFVETLQDDETDENKRHYLDIIHRNAIRLINIVKDLMLLSKVEDGHDDEFEIVDINQILSSVLTMYDKSKDLSKIDLKFDPSAKQAIILGDIYKLEQIFINLIDNAIKYSESIDLIISTEIKGNDVIIRFKDKGIGIPSDKLDRLFERFFVVDKSRSRKSGGTGLGLSLVKHIVNNHQGNITVSSEFGVGTEFEIVFKLQNKN